jgi:hypothetical protein
MVGILLADKALLKSPYVKRYSINYSINRTPIVIGKGNSALPIPALVAPPLLFPLLKFKDKIAYSWDKWRGGQVWVPIIN